LQSTPTITGLITIAADLPKVTAADLASLRLRLESEDGSARTAWKVNPLGD
jgi:hypothetical protein